MDCKNLEKKKLKIFLKIFIKKLDELEKNKDLFRFC